MLLDYHYFLFVEKPCSYDSRDCRNDNKDNRLGLKDIVYLVAGLFKSDKREKKSLTSYSVVWI